MPDDLAAPIKDACQLVLAQADLKPHDGKTFCNIGTHRICRLMGYEKLINLTANEIFDHLSSSEEWAPIDAETGHKCAQFGGLVVAAQKGRPFCKDCGSAMRIDDMPRCTNCAGTNIDKERGLGHGHCAVVYPDILLFSGKWKVYCPKVANVGPEKYFGIVGANYAFAAAPVYFWRKEMSAA